MASVGRNVYKIHLYLVIGLTIFSLGSICGHKGLIDKAKVIIGIRYDYHEVPDAAIIRSNQKLLERLLIENAFPIPTTKQQYFELKHKAIEDLESVLKLDSYPDFNPRCSEILHEERIGQVIRRSLSVQVEEDFWLPTYLFIPETVPAPLVLIIPGHGIGKAQTGTLIKSYQNSIAVKLAEAGFVVVTADYRGFGETAGWMGKDDTLKELQRKSNEKYIGTPKNDPIYQKNANFVNLIGRTNYGNMIFDSRQIITCFSKMEEVDSSRIGVGGVSLGGSIAALLPLLDNRIKVAVSSAALPSKPSADVYAGVSVHNVPSRLIYRNFLDFLKFLAPTPILFDSDLRDYKNRKSEIEMIRGNYVLTGNSEKIATQVHSNGHTFSIEPTIEWFKKWFKNN